jgi:hypothetical protein
VPASKQFEEKSAAVTKVMIEVACPHCGQTFKADSSEIGRRAKVGKAESQDEM